MMPILAPPPAPPLPTPPAAPTTPAAAVAVAAVTPSRPGLRKMSGVVVAVVRQTQDTSTLYFSVGETGEYEAGQFITIVPQQFVALKRWIAYLEVRKDAPERIRAYSMSSSPGEKYLSITVKTEQYHAEKDRYPPLLSPFLVSEQLEDSSVEIHGYSGVYTLPDDHARKTDQILHLCAGSGVVPNYSILKDQLRKQKNASVKHTMIYVNTSRHNIIFHDQLEALAAAFPNRFEVIHMLTREENPKAHGPRYKKGRPDTETIKSYIQDPSSVLVYACGPSITHWQKKRCKENGLPPPQPRFMESIVEAMKELNISGPRFKREVFG